MRWSGEKRAPAPAFLNWTPKFSIAALALTLPVSKILLPFWNLRLLLKNSRSSRRAFKGVEKSRPISDAVNRLLLVRF